MWMKFLTLLIFASALIAQAKRPNIVFIFSDDHAIKAMGAYNKGFHKTPNIDRLAAGGVVFDNSYCANSICGPSRACILTGKHSHKNGFRTNEKDFDGSQMSFPKLLQKSGYQTALIGKWHLGLNSDPQGFDYWKILYGQGQYYNPDFYSTDVAGQRVKDTKTGYVSDLITEMSLDWLEKRAKQKPFLLMCQHKAPHRSFAPPSRYLKRYSEKNFPEPATLFDSLENRTSALKDNEMSIDKDFKLDQDLKVFFKDETGKLLGLCHEYERMNPQQKKFWKQAYLQENEGFLAAELTERQRVSWKYQRYVKNYLRTIDAVDDSVGRIMDYLKQNNLLEDTLIVYSSDQGFYLGEHGWFDKRWMYEESFRMPLIMSKPSLIKAGLRVRKLVQNIDYAPTFLDLAGIKIPDEIQGRSLKPLLKGEEIDWRDSLYYHYYEENSYHNVTAHEGVIKGPFKLINFYHKDGHNLYDLDKDPDELQSVHGDIEYAGVLKEMQAELMQLRKKYEVPENNPVEDYPKYWYWKQGLKLPAHLRQKKKALSKK